MQKVLPAAPCTCELEEELVQLQQQNLFFKRIITLKVVRARC